MPIPDIIEPSGHELAPNIMWVGGYPCKTRLPSGKPNYN